MTTTPLTSRRATEASPTQPRARRRWVAAVATVVLVVLAAEAGARALAPRLPTPLHWNQREAALIVEQMKHVATAEGGADTVFLGSSVANFGFDPDAWRAATGRSAYNAALPGSSVISIERWAEEIVVPLLHPRTVVLGITTRDVNDSGSPQHDNLRQYLTSPERKHMLRIESSVERFERIAEERSALIRLRAYLRRPVDVVKQLEGKQVLERMIAFGPHGEPRFAEADYPFGDSPARRQWDLDALHGFAFARNMEAIARLHAWLDARGIRMVIVDMPVVASIYATYHPHGAADLTAYESALHEVASGAGIQVLSAPDSFAAEELHVDSIHLNRRGARAFTRAIAERTERSTV